VLYDNLEFNNQQQRINDTRDNEKIPGDQLTVMDEYDINYRWTDENLGRETITSSVKSVIKGLSI